jgi:SAM-dependent methyltransferase
METDLNRYGGYFDIVFMEGGILHYFHDNGAFMRMMYAMLKPGGRMICSDFHPFTKIFDSLHFGTPVMSYFSQEVFEGEMAHARFYEESVRKQIPKCLYRKYTISEIINAVIDAGFCLKRFDEHPSWEDGNLPGEFTAVAVK